MDFGTSIKTCFGKYADFKGRALRSEYWWFVLFCVLVSAGLSLVSEIAANLWALATLLPSLSAAARRLHDTGRSGWWQLISLTIIGLVPLIYWLAIEGEHGPNEHGEPPLLLPAV